MRKTKKYITIHDSGTVWHDMDDKEHDDMKKHAQKFDVWKPLKADKTKLENRMRTQKFKLCKGCKNKSLYCHKNCRIYKYQLLMQNLIKCIIRDQKQLRSDLAKIRKKIYDRIKRVKHLVNKLYTQTKVIGSQKHELPVAHKPEDLAMLWGSLTFNEQKVLRMCFGLDDIGKHTIAEIGKHMGLSISSVNNIKFRAIHKLYNKPYDEDYELCKNAYEASKRNISKISNYIHTII